MPRRRSDLAVASNAIAFTVLAFAIPARPAAAQGGRQLLRHPFDGSFLKDFKVSANVTNLAGIRGVSTAVVTGNNLGYQAYPVAPRMAFLTVAAKF